MPWLSSSSLYTHELFPLEIYREFAKKLLIYLCHGRALECVLAVDPSVPTWDALRPVPPQRHVGGETGRFREAEVPASGVPSAPMRWGCSGEDAHHHM